MQSFDIIVVGAGIFGVTSAIELQLRGHTTCLVDPGPIPHPRAASTDISKVVRMEYGTDDLYMEMVEASIPRWRDWNIECGETLFHETGVTMFTRDEMAPGGFEYESYQTLIRRGHEPERLNGDEISRRFPAWKSGTHVDGFFHSVGGFVESGRAVSALAEKAIKLGVEIQEGFQVHSILQNGNRVSGVKSSSGQTLNSERVLVAAGAWTPLLVPELARNTKISGHPVFHLRPRDSSLFQPEVFSTFMADTARTGWYGFPVHPVEGVIKMANHGLGPVLHPDDERVVTAKDEAMLRKFLNESFPSIAEAPIVYSRNCLYCDTLDEHFWIARHPVIDGLTVAAGGSGHGFKFAPILGGLIADAADGIPNPWLPRFAWRALDDFETGQEASRFHG